MELKHMKSDTFKYSRERKETLLLISQNIK